MNTLSHFTHLGMSILLMAVGCFILAGFAQLTQSDLSTLGSDLFRAGLVLSIGFLFPRLFIHRNKDVDAKIFETSLGMAVYAGAVLLALAIVLRGISL